MTDLLASLVDRALERTPVLQRRQPTLFEPVAGAAFGKQSQSENEASLEEQETVIESRPDSEGQKYFVNNASQVTPLLVPHRDPESQRLETRPADRRLVPHSPQPQNDDIRPEPVFTASVKEQSKTISPEEPPGRESKPPTFAKPEEITVAPPRLIETIVERRVEREIIKEHSADKPAIKEAHTIVQPDSKPTPSSDDDRAQRKPPLKAEVNQLTSPKEQTAIKPLIQKKPVARRDPTPIVRAVSRAESKQPLKQPTPPMINVTIGRVEVRATPPAAIKSRGVQPAGPKMSLEDYLRSRGEGN